eukprot:EG_transcript_29474
MGGCCSSSNAYDPADAPFYVGNARQPLSTAASPAASPPHPPPGQPAYRLPSRSATANRSPSGTYGTYSGRLASARPDIHPQLPPGVFLPPLDFGRLPNHQPAPLPRYDTFTTSYGSGTFGSGTATPQPAPSSLVPYPGQVFVTTMNPDGFGRQINR